MYYPRTVEKRTEVCDELVSALIRSDSNFRYVYPLAMSLDVIGSIMADGQFTSSRFSGAWYVVDILLWEDDEQYAAHGRKKL